MKKIKIKVRAYCSTFEIEILKKNAMSFQDAQAYVEKEIVSTATVISLSYLNDMGTITTLENMNYKDPSELTTRVKNIPSLYLKQKQNGENCAN